MMAELTDERRTFAPASPALIRAAAIAREAAEALADEAADGTEVARYLAAADRLADAIGLPTVARRGVLLASPSLTERSGRDRSLVEMIEAEPLDDQAQLRLAKLLFRALDWRPETFPSPRR